MPILRHITVFPIKALAGTALSEAEIAEGGALRRDRELALFDGSGGFVNGKRSKLIHKVAAKYDLKNGSVDLLVEGEREPQHFALESGQDEIAAFLGERLGFDIEVRRNVSNGYPDDTEAWGPTVVSTATLQEVVGWFPGLDIEKVRRRFRANLEIDGVPPFWEDRLFGPPGTTVPFEIGGVRFEGTNPCRRCVVPTRDPDTGDPYPKFVKILADRRRGSLPEWTHTEHFENSYRLSVNTRIDPSEAGKVLRVGDRLSLV